MTSANAPGIGRVFGVSAVPMDLRWLVRHLETCPCRVGGEGEKLLSAF